ncbi:hypothetical protein THRCLA_04199 [Thraustotheca clavata]|uniref:Uncharacterized protein n=1 Tax=Thraustotheca clavata TaxID=74557 RepID=A0A1V9ZZV6_9STRA|nr:hypothetical protein THRCLA_04199 [Thraustotheca clavata]
MHVNRRQAVAQTRSCWWLIFIGRLYIVLSIISSCSYVWVLSSYASNDFWWKGFTTQTSQTFLADVCNSQLLLNSTTSTPLILRLFDKKHISVAYPRQLLLDNDILFSTVIAALRAIDLSKNVKIFTRYCWVDFNKKYSLAFTHARARLYLSRKHNNAAVYLESMFRNTDKRELNEGNSPWLSVAEEVNYWKSNGLTQWQTECCQCIGASSKNNYFLNSKSATWPLCMDYDQRLYGIWNDLDDCQFNNCSLIRDVDSKSNKSKINGSNSTIQFSVHPHLSVTLVSKPSELTQLLTHFLALIHALIAQTDIVYHSKKIYAGPHHWDDGVSKFYGGNPMCIYATGAAFVQPPIGFYDTCGKPTQDLIDIDTTGVLWATWILGITEINLYSVCSLPLVAQNDPWSFFGLVMINDRLRGRSEGDIGAIVLISKANDLSDYQQTHLSFHSSFPCIFGLQQFTFLFSIQDPILVPKTYFTSIELVNLWWVVHCTTSRSVGYTSFELHSSKLTSSQQCYTFQVVPRSIAEILLIAGEATWISYIVVDVVLPYCPLDSHIYAPISMTIQPNFSIVQLGLNIVCHVDQVEVGSFNRLLVLLAINFGPFI